MRTRFWAIASFAVLPLTSFAPQAAHAQGKVQYDTTLYSALKWRSIGPFRGGRVTAVTGVRGQPYVYYFGGTGSGVWKTVDGGVNWKPISDGFFKAGSVGAIAVAPSDPNVIYAGTGEGPIRGNVSPGRGIYKSTDAGETWTFIGLEEAGQIGAIRVHPKDDQLVYVAALGHVFGPNTERGVFRSSDGGRTWEKILYKDENTGAIDLAMDPTNPRILYAGLWQARRMPWGMESGGPGSGIYKSTDGGDTWTDISRNKGLPDGILGKIGVTVSPANHERVWAIVEAKQGGVFRSDNGGETWTKVNSERRLRQRAWYYTHIHADTRDPETVYVLNTGLYRSTDGGKTYTSIRAPHGDHHGLWIDPDDPLRMINSNDGGANVSYNGGATWTRQDNQPTAQMYHVITTGDFPYEVCGAQQDNSTICLPSRTTGFGITTTDYHRAGGCESGYIAPDPRNHGVYFSGCYGGTLTRYDLSTGQNRNVMVWPENPMGWGAAELKYRFQWTFPILFDPFDPNTLYAAGNMLFKSTNDGQHWEPISPDLTRNDKSKQISSGGPITKDNTSVEYYGTIFAVAASPVERGLIWAGSDDGLIHLTRDGGASWTNVTPKNLPEWGLVSIIEASPHDAGTAYVAVTRYKLDDFAPYIFKTTDYGKSWKKIVRGIPEGHFIRVVREDPAKPGLLYAGGEFGVYVSFNGGADWQSLQLNLPVVPVHDMVIKNNDLVLATHGRSFWILDDLTELHQLSPEVASAPVHLFKPRDTYRMGGGGGFFRPSNVGQNPPAGVVVYYYLAEQPEGTVKLTFKDAAGNVIRSFKGTAGKEDGRAEERAGTRGGVREPEVPVKPGLNRFVWNMRYPDASRFDGMVLWAGSTRGPVAVPGNYSVQLEVAGETESRSFAILKDPRIDATAEDLAAQFDFLIQIRDRVSEANDAVSRIRRIKKQINGVTERLSGDSSAAAVTEAAKKIIASLSAVESEIYQVKNRSNQDPLNFPIKLNNKLAALASVVASADARPTDQAREVYDYLSQQLQVQLDELNRIIEADIPGFNRSVKELDVPAVITK